MQWVRKILEKASLAKPGQEIVVPGASVYVGPPREMTLDECQRRAKRLREVIPQFDGKIDRARRKLGDQAAEMLQAKKHELTQHLAMMEGRIRKAAEER